MFFRSSDQPRIDFNPYRALGAIAAEEVSKALAGQGRIVLVIPAPPPAKTTREVFDQEYLILRPEGSATPLVRFDAFGEAYFEGRDVALPGCC